MIVGNDILFGFRMRKIVKGNFIVANEALVGKDSVNFMKTSL